MTTTNLIKSPSNPKPSADKRGGGGGLRVILPRLRSRSSSSTMSSCSTQTSKPPFSREDELKEVFRYFDSDGDEKISALELRAYFGSIGEYMSEQEAQAAIDDLDSDGDKLLDFKDFLKLMIDNNNNSKYDYDHREEDLKNAFEMFEFEEKGCITPKGLQRMLNRLGDDKSLDECVTMIRAFDIDGNGVLDFHEFHQMMA